MAPDRGAPQHPGNRRLLSRACPSPGPRSHRHDASAGRGGVPPDEVTAWADDLTSLGRDYFFSLNRYLFIAST